MKKNIVAHVLAFISAVITFILVELLSITCSPAIFDDFAHPENSGIIKPCGLLSDFYSLPIAKISFSLFGIIVLFLLANFGFYKLWMKALAKRTNKTP